jgi:hypothetical protein
MKGVIYFLFNVNLVQKKLKTPVLQIVKKLFNYLPKYKKNSEKGKGTVIKSLKKGEAKLLGIRNNEVNLQ